MVPYRGHCNGILLSRASSGSLAVAGCSDPRIAKHDPVICLVSSALPTEKLNLSDMQMSQVMDCAVSDLKSKSPGCRVRS